MKELKQALLIVLSIVVFFALCFGIICLSQLTPGDDYYQKTGWNCSKETFTEDYFALYTQKLDHLKTKYALTCETLYDIPTEEEGEKIELALYCPQYTLYFSLVNSGEIGFCNTKLYYYGDDEEQLLSLLALLNDFTNYVGYGTITEENCFIPLRQEAASKENGYANRSLHFDNIIGDVQYIAHLSYEGGYYYLYGKDSSQKKLCSRYEFDGLLKPLDG